jgi:GPI mannosyltransferase 3
MCAWFSTGFHHADEHFQILEFCNYKMGFTYASDLPWEFHQKVRSALLPGIAFWLARIMEWFNLYNPFTLVFLLRLFTGVANWFIVCKLCIMFSSKFKTSSGEKLFIFMSLFLWFVPYLSVRFTFENISGILLLYGIYFILRIGENTVKSAMPYIMAGLLFGVSLFIRFQIVFAIAGFTAWLILIKRIGWKYLFILIISINFGVGINILVDHWFYGEWTFTPYNYFYANIIQHKAADYGVSPWWFYFSDFIIRAIPPISLLLIFMFLTGLYKNIRDPMAWVIVPFLFAHIFINHKEIRFLFPVSFIFIYITSLGFDHFLERPFYKKIHTYFYKVSLIVCIPLLIFRTVAPAQASINYYEFLYNYIPEKQTTNFVLRNDDYFSSYCLPTDFYKRPSFREVAVEDINEMKKYLKMYQPQSAIFLSKQNNIASLGNISGYSVNLIYCYYPSWILKFDINNWEERSQIWSIYKFDKTD